MYINNINKNYLLYALNKVQRQTLTQRQTEKRIYIRSGNIGSEFIF